MGQEKQTNNNNNNKSRFRNQLKAGMGNAWGHAKH